VGILHQPLLLDGGVLGQSVGEQRPDRRRVVDAVPRVELLDRKRRAELDDAALADEPRQPARRVGAAAESEDEYLVAVVEVLDQPCVGLNDFVGDAPAGDAAARGLAAARTDALGVVDALISRLRRQALQAPYVGVVVQRVPSSVEEDREPFHGTSPFVA
jgi:hypothetical protein